MCSLLAPKHIQPVHAETIHKFHDSDQAITMESRQDAPHLLPIDPFHDETEAATTNRTTIQRLCGPTNAEMTDPIMERPQTLDARDSQPLDTLRRPDPLPVTEHTPGPGTRSIRCIACCNDPKPGQTFIRPCSHCSSAFCPSCLKEIFLWACEDVTRMPPGCCLGQIHLHHVRRYLTVAEEAEYKTKYEERTTLRPFYCPVPTCSFFISNRLVPQQEGDGSAETFSCPACEGQICVDCRQTAHPDNVCATLDRGIDLETAAALKRLGYKRCPKCSHGLKKIDGCRTMHCRCGASFCWICTKSLDDCSSKCRDEEGDEDTEEILDSDSEVVLEDVDLNREPTNYNLNQPWECRHSFYTVTSSYAETAPRFTGDMECVKCWRTIHPEPEKPGGTPINIAQECRKCAIIVCQDCRDEIQSRQQKWPEKQAVEDDKNDKVKGENVEESGENEGNDDPDYDVDIFMQFYDGKKDAFQRRLA